MAEYTTRAHQRLAEAERTIAMLRLLGVHPTDPRLRAAYLAKERAEYSILAQEQALLAYHEPRPDPMDLSNL